MTGKGRQVSPADDEVCMRVTHTQQPRRHVCAVRGISTRHESYHSSMAERSKVWPSMTLTGSVISWNEMAQKKAPGASVLALMLMAAPRSVVPGRNTSSAASWDGIVIVEPSKME